MNNFLAETTERHRHQMEALPQLRSMLGGTYSKSSYAQFLIQLYPIVSNFCPLMAAASGRCADRHNNLRLYLYEHIAHEQGHEAMVKNDLEELGYKHDDLPGMNPGPAARVMLAYNYHAIDRVDPHYVIGMIYVLELMSAGYASNIAQSISRAIDHPLTRGFSFLDSHGTLDDDHLASLMKLIQSLESPELVEKVVDSIDMNFYLLRQLISDLPQN
jgi:pyrroloquinoline quinone (PQQ) biosynthesis protein C